MKALHLLYLILMFNVVMIIFRITGIGGSPTGETFTWDVMNIASILDITGSFTIAVIIGGTLGINPMASIFYGLFNSVWSINLMLLKSTLFINIDSLAWVYTFLLVLGQILAIFGAMQIASSGWSSYE